MAVLKDLIVHGPSRFIGITEFTNLKANKIKATEGIFNKLIATTADFDSMTANNATVVGLLDVKGELHTNSWTNSNIATIEGSFYITPTVSCASGTFNYDGTNITLTAASGYSFAVSSLYINSGENAGTTAAWTAYSEVLITGQVAVGNEKVPLGTIKGKITSTAPTTSKIIINSLTDGKGGASNVLASIGTGSKTFYDVKVSLLKRGNTSDVSKALPIGIFMTAMGQNGRTFIDIYGGHNAASTTVGGGLAKPVLRIGNLNGMPAIGGVTPGGYGIYTSNGYFTGTIVSTSGKIADFTISGTKLYSGTHSAYNTAVTGIYIGTDYVAGGSGGVWWLKSDGSAKIGAMTLTAAGVLSVPAANISGKLTASQINVSTLSAITANMGTLTAGTISYGTVGSNASFYLSNADKTATIAGAQRTGLRLAIGSGFGVNSSGTLYASGANIAGTITSTAGTIGGWTLSGSSIYKYANSAGATVAAAAAKYYVYIQSAAGTNGGNYAFALRSRTDDQVTANSPVIGSADVQFGVSWTGYMYARNADVSGKITANSGYIGGTSGWTIAAQQLSSGTLGSNNSLFLATKNLGSSTSIAGRAGSDWRLTVGSAFGVTNTGALYASSGSIGGSVTIGGTAASTVLTNISTAQSTANTAKTNAATAQTTANTANTNATNAAKTATNYIANIDSNNGITIKAINGTINNNATTGNYIKLNVEGLDIYQGGVSVAKYGAETRIGLESGFKTLISAGGIQLTDSNGDNNFTISPSPLSFTTRASARVIVKSSGTSVLIANLSQYTLNFVLQRTTAQGVAQVTKTNADVAIGGSFTLGTSTYKVTITRTAANTFSIKRSGSSTANLMLSVNWTSTSESMATINFSGANSVLWSGASYMTAAQSARLSEPITAQLNGIVLAWSAYVDGAAEDYDWVYTFIPKNHIFLYDGRGVQCGTFSTMQFNHVGAKYVYVSDELITGNDRNNQTGSKSGINYDNKYWVLRYVYGV